MESVQLYEVSLGNSFKDKKIDKKVARVVFGVGSITKNGKKQRFFIPCIDIRNYGPGTHCGVSFTNVEFEWFINSVMAKTPTSVYVGQKTHILTRVRNDGSISICTSENDRIFGLVLSDTEFKKLYENRDYLSFVLKYRSATGEQLSEITKSLYVLVLVGSIKANMKSRCDECIVDDNDIGSHYCKKDFHKLPKSEKDLLLDLAINDPTCDAEFIKVFKKLMNILHIKDYDRTEQLNVFWPNLKKQMMKLEREVIEYNITKHGLMHLLDLVVEKVDFKVSETHPLVVLDQTESSNN